MYLSWLVYYLTVSILAHMLSSSGVYGKKQIVCNSSYCKKLATEFLQNRNIAVDPCKNFHEYACGSWKKYNPMPKYARTWSHHHTVQLKIFKRIRDLLLEKEKDTDIPPVKSVKKYYRSCLDTERIEKDGIKLFLQILNEASGWPMAMPKNAWNERKKIWQEIDMYYYQFLGHSTFYELKAVPSDKENSTENILQISPNLHLPLSDIEQVETLNTTHNGYVKGIIRVAMHIAKENGYDLNKTELTQDVVDMLLFEIKLTKLTSNGLTKPEYLKENEKTTLPKLHGWYDKTTVHVLPDGKINFLHLNETLFHVANVSIAEDEEIKIIGREHFVKLSGLLQSTPKRVIVNYINWNLIFALLPYLTPIMSHMKFDMLYEEFDVTAYLPRWQDCVMNMKMKDVASHMFLERYLSFNVTMKAMQLTQAIQLELENLAGNATGLPRKLKDSLKKKLHEISNVMGAPNWYRNVTVITEKYEGLTIGDNFFRNVINCQKFDSISVLKQIRNPSGAKALGGEPTTVNAYYSPSRNKIIIPGADFQDPLFTTSMPEAVNYGFVGMVIGHELSHAIDNTSINYKSKGQCFNWTDSELKEYREKSMCFVKQYNSYIVDVKDDDGSDLSLNGTLTLEENMADTTGLEGAYLAYKRLEKDMNYEIKLPGLESLSGDELFFLSFANIGCMMIRPKFSKYLIKYEKHSPYDYRIIGTISNSQQFAKVYKCPVGSPMNPKKKCNIFD